MGKRTEKEIQIDLEALIADEQKKFPSAPQRRYHDALGREIPDPMPMAPPVGYKKPPSMVELVRDMVRSERLRQEAEAAEQETFEESEDFDIGDDYDPHSPWENDFDPPLSELRHEVEAELIRRKAQEGPPSAMAVPPSDGPKPTSEPGKPARADAKPSGQEPVG